MIPVVAHYFYLTLFNKNCTIFCWQQSYFCFQKRSLKSKPSSRLWKSNR